VPEIQRTAPPYAQVAAHIREQILSGVLAEGDPIPSARKIKEEWGISLATATKVIAALRSQGLVEARAGIGTIVTAPTTRLATPHDRIRTTRRTGETYAPDEYSKIIKATTMPAPQRIAEALAVEAGSTVVCRHRVTYRGEVAVSASTSWFVGELAEVAPRLLELERIQQGTWRYVEEVTGRTVVAGRDQFSAGAASEEESQSLGVEVGSTVLRGRNWFMDSHGDVVEYGESVARPGLWTTYEYTFSD